MTLATKIADDLGADDVGSYIVLTGLMNGYETKVFGVVRSVMHYSHARGDGIATDIEVALLPGESVTASFTGDEVTVSSSLLEIMEATINALRMRPDRI
ncbi:hypothetical protein [Gordonia sp. (in: high G+C Gram-positive bacteria)]|uniref:hypothetical protein n=1 Tax=Gordonia sp. (in: high G+C Gram-positive bacteria) TaxID=84139 RepID=UPI0033424A7C